MKQSFVLSNLCAKVRVKTKDGHVIQVFSSFYSHPAMINEDGWHMVKSGSLPILVDHDTLAIMKDLECEWGFKASSDMVITLKLTCHEKDEVKRNALLQSKLAYAKRIKAEMNDFFDKPKIEELSSAMSAMSCSDTTLCSEPAGLDLPESGPTLERIPEEIV